ncbi:MAG: hypothetical protein Q3M24_14925 [Candidatus Electrothrix aestuarii]|uniref:Uncharacterized protein n=1 Tax=Candidatus Electrothrix aestuarii TaxID=3062594 RepID=A0AAU8LQN1_9BACT|nr:hypothetical protein [Candidatus Electrothrix aestuarii]
MPEKTVTEQIAEILNVEFPSPPDPSQVKALHRALPGYQNVVDDAIRFAEKHGTLLNLDGIRSSLEQSKTNVNHLEPVEHLLERLYQSIYYQRLQGTDGCMGGLYDITRRIRDFSEAYPEIAEEGKPLLDFMKAFKPGRKKE